MPRVRGFSLLEVLVAVTLLGAILTLVMGLLSRGLRDIGEAERRSEAAVVLQGLLDNSGRTERLQPGTTEGEVAAGRFRWVRVVSVQPMPWPLPADDGGRPPTEGKPAGSMGVDPGGGEPQLLRVGITLRWGEDESQSMQASTLRAQSPLASPR